MPSETKRTINKVVDEINSDLTIAQVANKNTIAHMRHITKEILSHSYKAEKSKIGGLGLSGVNLLFVGASIFLDEKQRLRICRIATKNDQNAEFQKNDLGYKWSQAKTKLDSYHIENLFTVIKINKTMGFRVALAFILENRIYLQKSILI